MQKPTQPKVRSIGEYVSLIEAICAAWGVGRSSTSLWFRGQTSATWNLIPSLYRGEIKSHLEKEIIRDFKLRAQPFLRSSPSIPRNDIEWMFLMQHFGLPTRLLDWTENYLTALYFAVRNQEVSKDGCVWILHPWQLNQCSIGVQSAPTADSEQLSTYFLKDSRAIQAQIPVAVRPNYSSERIQAQEGVFTLHGARRTSLDSISRELPRLASGLVRLVIAGSRKRRLLSELFRAGVYEARLFPDLQGLSASIAYRYSNSYLKVRKASDADLCWELDAPAGGFTFGKIGGLKIESEVYEIDES